MKKLIAFFIFGCLALTNSFAQYSIEVKGKVQFVDKDFKITAYQRSGTDKKILAEVPVNEDQTYQITIPVDEPGAVSLNCAKWQDVSVWVEDENLEVDFRGKDTAKIVIKNPPFVYIKGGKKNEVMNLMNFEVYRNYQSMIGFSQAAYKAPIQSDKERQEFSFSLYNIGGENYKAHLRYLAEHYADCSSVIAVLSGLNPDEDAVLIDKTLTVMEAANPGTKIVATYRAKVAADREKRERMKVGNPAPLFSYEQPDGKKISPADYKGKILVLDFWASWCGPCRQEVPNLKKYYEEFKDQGLEMLSVSVDAKRPDWEKAMKEEAMPWKQALAPKGGKEIMATYQFNGIPFILVIDREGKIYAKNVRGERLYEAIKNAIDNKKVEASKGGPSIIMGASM